MSEDCAVYLPAGCEPNSAYAPRVGEYVRYCPSETTLKFPTLTTSLFSTLPSVVITSALNLTTSPEALISL